MSSDSAEAAKEAAEQKLYDEAWAEMDGSVNQARIAFNNALRAANDEKRQKIAQAWKQYRETTQKAQNRFRERTVDASP